jgi:hypothetical protein
MRDLIRNTDDVGWNSLQTVHLLRDGERHPTGKFYDLAREEAPQSVLKISCWFCERSVNMANVLSFHNQNSDEDSLEHFGYGSS